MFLHIYLFKTAVSFSDVAVDLYLVKQEHKCELIKLLPHINDGVCLNCFISCYAFPVMSL